MVIAKNKKKTSLADKVFVVFNTVFMIMFVIAILYPIWHLIVKSFSQYDLGAYAFEGKLYQNISAFRLWPKNFTLENYKSIIFDKDMFYAIYNSVLRTVIGTILGVSANAWLAFILSRKEFKFKSQLSFFWIITIYLECGIIPTLVLYQKLNLTENFWVYIIPGIISGLYVIVMRTYMNGISESMIDEAKMDGASYTQIFTKIVSPICKPLYASIALFIATTHWNSWFDTIIYNRTKKEYTTLGAEIFQMSIKCNCGYSSFDSFAGYKAAKMVIAMLPIILLGVVLQKYYVMSVEKLSIKE